MRIWDWIHSIQRKVRKSNTFIALPLRRWRETDAQVVGRRWSVSQSKLVSPRFYEKAGLKVGGWIENNRKRKKTSDVWCQHPPPTCVNTHKTDKLTFLDSQGTPERRADPYLGFQLQQKARIPVQLTNTWGLLLFPSANKSVSWKLLRDLFTNKDGSETLHAAPVLLVLSF